MESQSFICPISKGELDLLSKGLQYNLTYSNINQWLENLIIETDVAISKLPINHQEGIKYLKKRNNMYK
jgi:hypothetical protein